MKRNKFNLSNFKDTTGNQGEMIPINTINVIPGDTVQQATTALIRFSPLLAPVMHPVHARIQHYFVPFRLIWDDFEDFITGGEDGLDSSTFPTVDVSSVSAGTLEDYLGLPVGTYTQTEAVSALPFRAYNLIWNEYVRNTRLQTAKTIDLTSGADTTTERNLLKVNWQKDRFTNAADDTQLGTEISLPLGTSAPVNLDTTTGNNWRAYDAATGAATTLGGNMTHNTSPGDIDSSATGNKKLILDPNGTLNADLSSATAATINDLRRSIALQKFAEARQLYGSRYVEYLRYMGVKSSDGRLDRPEYLGGGRQVVQFSEVLSTDGANTGDMKGHGIASVRSNRYRRYFEEHGIVMSFLSVMPKTIYSQGIPKEFLYTDRTDFFQKELANIGLTEIENKEVYAMHTSPDGVWGYQRNYDELRSSVSTISGDFNGGGNLDHWTMARVFSSDPALNSNFLEANPTDRIYAATTEDQMYIMAQNNVQARRPIPRNGNPIGVM